MKYTKSLFAITLLSSVAGAQPSATPPTPQVPAVSGEPTTTTNGAAHEETLTLQKAIDLAMKQQPTIRQARAAIEGAEGRVDAAKVARKPTVALQASLGASSSRSTGIVTGSSSSGFWDPFITTGLSASAGWRIYDFGLTSANIRAAEANADAVRSEINTTNLDVENNVAVAFLEVVARERLIAVAESTVKSEEQHLDQARRFVAAQAKDPIEVSQAQARAANARSSLAQSQSDAAVALANLRSAIGWVDPNTTFAVDNQWPTPPEKEPTGLPALVDTARKNRPEIISAEKQITAAEASRDASAASRRPVLSASASTAYQPNEDDWSPDPTWNAGLVLSWQLYDGGAAAAQVRIANASVMSAQASRDSLLISLTSELDAARQRIIANRANVQASTEAVTAAREQLKLADARYAQGLGSQIELADAQTAVTTAEGNLITADWNLANAWVTLRRALGGVRPGA
ncbi:MAG TPA: TolC family protein [Kofleriaceae bacterium]